MLFFIRILADRPYNVKYPYNYIFYYELGTLEECPKPIPT